MTKERKLILGCGKLGVLEYNRILYGALGFSEEEIVKLLMWDEENLKEGCYTIDNFGAEYHG